MGVQKHLYCLLLHFLTGTGEVGHEEPLNYLKFNLTQHQLLLLNAVGLKLFFFFFLMWVNPTYQKIIPPWPENLRVCRACSHSHFSASKFNHSQIRASLFQPQWPQHLAPQSTALQLPVTHWFLSIEVSSWAQQLSSETWPFPGSWSIQIAFTDIVESSFSIRLYCGTMLEAL